MKVLVVSFGSRGDVQPMALLGAALKRRGHEVVFTGPATFRGLAESFGLPLEPVGADIQALFAQDRDVTSSPLTFFRKAGSLFRAEVAEHFRGLKEAAPGCQAVVCGGYQLAASSIAEWLNVPFIEIAFAPSLFRSRHYPPMVVPLRRTPKWLNSFMWSAYGGAMNALLRRPVNEQRALLGLPPARDMLALLQGSMAVVAADPELVPVPPDLTTTVSQTGSFIVPSGGVLPQEVDAFIPAGAPPIYVGFGSMADPDPVRTTRIIVDAVTSAGVRALIHRGWARLGEGQMPAECLLVDELPHRTLFPRLAAVVHHGGAGTTSAACRSGVPQIVVPHIADQFHWGRCVHGLGVAPTPIPRSRLDAARLAEAIRACVSDPSIGSRARALSSRLESRNGIDAAVAIIEGASRAGQESRRLEA